MPKPPPTPPASDLEGVDRDWRPGVTADKPEPHPGRALKQARDLSIGRPEDSESRDEDER